MNITLGELRQLVTETKKSIKQRSKLSVAKQERVRAASRLELKVKRMISVMAHNEDAPQDPALFEEFSATLKPTKKRLFVYLVHVAAKLAQLEAQMEDYEEGDLDDEELGDEHAYGEIGSNTGLYALEEKIANTEDEFDRTYRKVFPKK